MRITLGIIIGIALFGIGIWLYTSVCEQGSTSKIALTDLTRFTNTAFVRQDQKFFRELLQLSQTDTSRLKNFLQQNRDKGREAFPHLVHQWLLESLLDSATTTDLGYDNLYCIARCFRAQFKEPALLNQLRWAQGLTRNQKINQLEAFHRINRGDSLRKADLPQSALSEYHRAAAIFHQMGDSLAETGARFRIGFTLLKDSQYSKSKSELEKSRNLARTIQEPYYEMVSLIRMAEAMFELRSYDHCQQALAGGIALAQQLDDSLALANALTRLGRVYQETGFLLQSLQQFEACLEIYDALENVPKKASTLSMIGHSYVSLGDYFNAIQAHESALQIYRDRNLPEQVAAQLSNIGTVYEGLGEYERALDYFIPALKIFTEHKALSYLASAHANLGETYCDLGQFDLALDHLNQALEYAKKPDFNARRAEIYEIIAKTRIRQGKYDLARARIDSAYRFNKAANFLPGMILDHQYMGEIDLKRGNWLTASLHFDEALRLALKSGASGCTWKAFYGKGLAHKALNEFPKALECFQAAIDTIESGRRRISIESAKLEYLAEKQDVYDEMIRTLLDHYEDPYRAFNYLERARARSFLDFLSGSVEIVTPADPSGQDSGDLTLVSSGAVQTYTYQEIQSTLRPMEQIIEYRLLPDRVAIWWLTTDSLKYFQVWANRDDLRNQVLEFRQALGASDPEEFKKNFKRDGAGIFARVIQLSVQLSKILIDPLWPQIQGQPKLYIIPDDFLHYLPFAALTEPGTDGNRFLIESIPITTAPSAAVLRHVLGSEPAEVKSHPIRLLVISDPLGDLNWARASGQTISPLFSSSQLLLGAQARKTTVNKHLSAGYDIVHFGTHCVINEKSPLYSALLLYSPVTRQLVTKFAALRSVPVETDAHLNDHLFMHQVFKLDLKQTRLVVLSACETALGRYVRGEGLVGLSQAFMGAGVPTLVTTLWKVDDKATANLMIKFYQNIKSGDLPVNEALRQAQMTEIARMRTDPVIRHPHPFLWAPFVITGRMQKL